MKNSKYDFLYEVDSTSLQASYENLIQAMKNFYNKIAGYQGLNLKKPCTII